MQSNDGKFLFKLLESYEETKKLLFRFTDFRSSFHITGALSIENQVTNALR